MRRPALGHVTEQRAGLVDTAGPPRFLRALHRVRRLGIVVAGGGRTLETESAEGAMTERGERRE
jgi:hypothetical protein